MIRSTSPDRSRRSAARARGFTLIEIMVVVAIVGILAAIAIPSYQKYLQKSRRIDAKNALLDLAAREEKYFATNNTYTASGTLLGLGATLPMNIIGSGTAYYTLNATLTPASGYTATATPIASGPQATDACGTYVLDYLGNQTSQTAAGGAVTTSGCW